RWFLDDRVRDGLHPDVPLAVPGDCLHVIRLPGIESGKRWFPPGKRRARDWVTEQQSLEETHMSTVTETVDVHVPVRTAYNQWTQFESFPQFMNGVEAVTQLDDRRTHWVTKIGGVRREFDAEITEQHPDERIAWKSTGGDTKHAGVVTFHRL